MSKKKIIYLGFALTLFSCAAFGAVPSFEDMVTRIDNLFIWVVKLFMRLSIVGAILLGVMAAKFLFIDHDRLYSRRKGLRFLGGAVFLAIIGLALFMAVAKKEAAGDQYWDDIDQYMENVRDW